MGKLTNDIKLAGRMASALFLAVLRIQQTRRKMMFTVSLSAMLFAFLGVTLLDKFLTQHPLIFLLYWLFCGAQVVFMVLLAIYDFAAVRGEHHVRTDRELSAVLKDIEEAARGEAKVDPKRSPNDTRGEDKD